MALAVSIAVLAGCSSNETQSTYQPPPPPPASAVAWLQNYYTVEVVGGGWQFTSVAIENNEISATFEIPADRALALDSKDFAGKITVARSALCPGSQEDIWRKIKPGELNVFLKTGERLVFNTNCG